MSSPASIEALDESLQPVPTVQTSEESEQIDTQIGSVLTRAYSEHDDCPICKEPFEHPATITPCGHKFDLTCICTWAFQTRGVAPTFCPICRVEMVDIRHYWDDPYNGPGESNPDPQLVIITLGRNLDESILPGMTDRQIRAALERRRLRRLGRRQRSCTMLPQPQNFWVKHGKYFANMIEFYDLLIVQEGLVTTSKLKTWVILDFKYRDSFDQPPDHRTDRVAQEIFAEVYAMTKKMLAKYIHFDTTSTVTISHSRDNIARDERGISSSLERKAKLSVLNHRGPKSVLWEQKSTLVEHGPANADGDFEVMDPDERPGCGRRIRRAVADMRVLMQETTDENDDELDRATTNLLEGEDLRHFESDGRSASPNSRHWRRVRRTWRPSV